MRILLKRAVVAVRVAIIDDERAEREALYSYLTRFAQESGDAIEVDQYPSSDVLLADYRLIYDILIFDIDMPGTNGLDAARLVREQDRSVVILFVTNMAQYAIRGYEVEAADYIIKPVEYYDFAMKFRRAAKRAARNSSRELTLVTVDGIRRVKVPDIVYVEAFDHYLTYHICEKDTDSIGLEVRGNIGEHENLLKPYNFCRVHKSFLVNLSHVDVIRSSEVVLKGIAVPIGRRYKKDLMGKYLQFVR